MTEAHVDLALQWTKSKFGQLTPEVSLLLLEMYKHNRHQLGKIIGQHKT